MVRIKYLLFLLLLQIFQIIAENQIKIIYDDKGLPYTSVCFGTKKLCLSLRLDTDYVDSIVHSSSSKNSVKNKIYFSHG